MEISWLNLWHASGHNVKLAQVEIFNFEDYELGDLESENAKPPIFSQGRPDKIPIPSMKLTVKLGFGGDTIQSNLDLFKVICFFTFYHSESPFFATIRGIFLTMSNHWTSKSKISDVHSPETNSEFTPENWW